MRNPSHGNQYVEACGHVCRGYGISTRSSRRAASEFEIYHWRPTNASGNIMSGDSVYFRNPSHGNQYVEACGHFCGGYGIATYSSRTPSALFKIYHWTGKWGAIMSGDSVYLRNPSHGNQYVGACGHACGGYGISAKSAWDFRTRFTIHSICGAMRLQGHWEWQQNHVQADVGYSATVQEGWSKTDSRTEKRNWQKSVGMSFTAAVGYSVEKTACTAKATSSVSVTVSA